MHMKLHREKTKSFRRFCYLWLKKKLHGAESMV